MAIRYGGYDEQSQKNRDAYEAGNLAYHQGFALDANPHALDKPEHIAWAQGWRWGDDRCS